MSWVELHTVEGNFLSCWLVSTELSFPSPLPPVLGPPSRPFSCTMLSSQGSAGEDVLPVSAAQRVLYCVRTPRHSSGCCFLDSSRREDNTQRGAQTHLHGSFETWCSCTAGSQDRIKVLPPGGQPLTLPLLLSVRSVPCQRSLCLLETCPVFCGDTSSSAQGLMLLLLAKGSV